MQQHERESKIQKKCSGGARSPRPQSHLSVSAAVWASIVSDCLRGRKAQVTPRLSTEIKDRGVTDKKIHFYFVYIFLETPVDTLGKQEIVQTCRFRN